MADRRVSASAIAKRKGARFPVVTAYDAPFAAFVEQAGIDVILVGDTLGEVVLGHPGTTSVDLVDMERHAAAVVRGTRHAHIIGDLPFGAYEPSDEDAVRSAVQLVKRAGVSSVKLEHGRAAEARTAAIVGAGVPVVGHIGVRPQTAALSAGFRLQRDRTALLADAHAVEAAGAFAIVLEMVEDDIAAEITATLGIPTIGIGSGPNCDAQVLVLHDMLGIYPNPPPFVRRFADIASAAVDGLRAYADAVRSGEYPEERRAKDRDGRLEA
ncbi:MAG: 3-methyl-2-oxobutanoate hydroxymethyltransferase [Candidatus Eremiobacteraeota bacterium]|nr:3-methyl-2-oxobutanoate hydroxymethyltransferase [Candidatus Eremiobacteraeota bacterium]